MDFDGEPEPAFWPAKKSTFISQKPEKMHRKSSFPICHTLCGIATPVVTPRLRREDITRRSWLAVAFFIE
jgi:hypothetical protein